MSHYGGILPQLLTFYANVIEAFLALWNLGECVMTLALLLTYLFPLLLKYILLNTVKIIVFRQLCKAKAKTPFQILSVGYISTLCVRVHIFKQAVIFTEGRSFSFSLNIQN